MNSKTIVHFGAGALGRGLVIPLLTKSGYDVVIADTDEALNAKLKKDGGYEVDFTDDPVQRMHTVRVRNALSPAKDSAELQSCLRNAAIITTSVRRENLVHVTKTLAAVWGAEPNAGRSVYCCENVEKVGEYFKTLLLQEAKTPEQRENLQTVRVPDTIVDRICSANWPETSVITSECYYECMVDGAVAPETGIELIRSCDTIEGAFMRKRFLVNTYADAISFFALERGMKYLYEAAQSKDVNGQIAPFLGLLKRLLNMEFNYSLDGLDAWAAKCRDRLSNPYIPRDLHTVARNLWQKLTLDERFVFPVVRMMRKGQPVEEGVAFLTDLITAGLLKEPGQTKEAVTSRIRELWAGTPEGRALYLAVAQKL